MRSDQLPGTVAVGQKDDRRFGGKRPQKGGLFFFIKYTEAIGGYYPPLDYVGQAETVILSLHDDRKGDLQPFGCGHIT